MNSYPEIVAKIVSDYLERVKSHLRAVPAQEQNEFLKEIESHLYEAYQQMPGEDEVARILAVLRNFGEPADVVSDRLPGTMVRSGTRRNLPLYVVAGILIAIFGVPLGFGGLGVLIGLLAALTGVMVAFYAAAGSVFLSGALITACGLIRFLAPGFFDRLVDIGVIQLGGPVGEFLDHFSTADQGLMMMLAGCILLGIGFGLLWVGKRMLRGLRFLFSLSFDWIRRLGRRGRKSFQRQDQGARAAGRVAFANGGK